MANSWIDSAEEAAYCHDHGTVNYNPYSPPAAPGSALVADAIVGQPQPWSPSEALSLAWARFKEVWPVLVGSYVLMSVVVGVLGQMTTVLLVVKAVQPSTPAYYLAFALTTIISQTVSVFFQVGQLRLWLAAARGNPLSFAVMFSGADRFLPLLVSTLLMILAIGFGLVLFIVPGIILALGLFSAGFYVVDARLGPVEALKASWALAQGQKTDLFGLALAGLGLAILGCAMCCIGMFATFPIYGVATAIAFVRLSGRGVAQPAAVGEPAPWAAPPVG